MNHITVPLTLLFLYLIVGFLRYLIYHKKAFIEYLGQFRENIFIASLLLALIFVILPVDKVNWIFSLEWW